MKKKARRIRYVVRRKGRRKKGKKNPMGLPTWVLLLGGGAAAFFIIKKMKEKKAAPAPTAAQLAAQAAGAGAQAVVSKITGQGDLGDLYADMGVGGVLSSNGMGSLS
jgi:hypothetical protein